MQGSRFYVRLLMDQVPEDRRTVLAFREERNYPVLSVDAEKGRMLLPDDSNKLIWVPMAVCRFVKLG